MKPVSYAALLGASALSLVAPAAFAQVSPPVPQTAAQPSATPDAPSANADEEGTVIVTARRRDEAIQDVPAVINAITSEEAAKLNFRTFNDIQSVVPGLTLTNLANGTGGNAQLRGVNFDVNASGNNPTVEFYFDDAPITAGVILQQLYDVGQIEVLRGPQGTLRGRASPSGSITIASKKPDLYEPGGNISMTGNDIGTINFNGALGLPIIPGKLAIRVAGVIQQDDLDRVRTIKTTGDPRAPYSESKSGRISAVAQPFDALRLEGVFQRLGRYNRGFDQVESFNIVNPAAAASPTFISAADRLSNEESPRLVKQKYDIYNGRAELAELGQRLIYQFQHYSQNIDSFVTVDPADIFPRYDPTQNTSSRIKSTSHEVRLQNEARVFGLFDYVLGFFDNTNDTPTNLVIQTPVFLPAFLGGGLATTAVTNVSRLGHSNEKSYFGNLTAHIGESNELSGGLRYITYHSNGALIVSGNTINDPIQDTHHVIYTASAKHFFSHNLMIYASTGTSFRPGIDAIGDFSVAQSARESTFLHLQPETSQSYEAGIKTTILNDRGHLNLSGFHQNFTNYPYRAPGNGIYYVNYAATVSNGVVTVTPQVSQFNFVAAVPVEVNGVEGEFNYDLSSRLKFSVVGAYALGRIKSGTVPCNDLNGDGVPDAITTAPSLAQLQAAYGTNNVGSCKVSQRSSFQPPFTASVQGEYDLPISHFMEGYARGLLTYFGRSQGDPQNPYDNQTSYALFNLYAGVRDPRGRWEINLFAKNIFNTTKVLTQGNPLSTTYQVLQPPTFRTAAATTTTSTYVPITTTIPREFGVNLRFNFGSR